ncbi:unnamed protein product [Protopolystoma xenopodis]|uniref:Uncharacterized protein n=1 Tax=Protopolystoma xenopodis TaxID=117903 RepID=A0A3S5C141_9PLAT|nr:unnamed protein product [Protopolystoma xenopodis]
MSFYFLGGAVLPSSIPPTSQSNQPAGRRLLPADPRLHHAMARSAMTKRKRRLADRLLTKTVRQIIPESESYMELLEVEKKLDLVLMHKRLTLQEAMKKPFKTKRKLRIMLSSIFKPGTPPSIRSDGQIIQPESVPGWELKVEGQLLDKSGSVCSHRVNSMFLPLI